MLKLAKDRLTMAQNWQAAIGPNRHPEIVFANEVPKKAVPKGFMFYSAINELILLLLLTIVPRTFLTASKVDATGALGMLSELVLFVLFAEGIPKLLRLLSPQRTIMALASCVLNAMKETGIVESKTARYVVEPDDEQIHFRCMLMGATTHEKTVFEKAIEELLSAIDNPRYVLIKRIRLLFIPIWNAAYSYACPSCFAANRETVDVLVKHLDRLMGKFIPYYTRSADGRRILLKCRRASLLNINEIIAKGKPMVSKWE
jgi:hypothetical protein